MPVSFSKDFVYYQLLKADAADYNKPYLMNLYNDAVSNIQSVSFNRSSGTSNRLLAMAKAEATKEQALLNQVFGANVSSDFNDASDVKALTEAINTVFHFRQVFERNKAMLTSSQFQSGVKAVFSWFPTYFIRFFSKQQKTITNEIGNAMAANSSLTLKQATRQVMDKLVPEIEFKAVRAMLTEAGTEVGVDNEYQQAYMEIFQAIEQDFLAGRSNPFLDGIYKTYGLDKIAAKMSAQVNHKSKDRMFEDVSSGVRNIDKAIRAGGYGGATVYTGGGYTAEHLIDQVLSMVMQDVKSGSNGTMKWNVETISGIGGHNARPDNILLFTEQSTSLLQDLENDLKEDDITKRDRSQAVDAFTRLSNNLANLNSGFVVYFNDKNYNVGSGAGHKAGQMTLAQLQTLLSGVIDNISQLVYNILQATKGAVGENLDENTSNTIAQAVAYFLYDDYSTIGSVSTGGQSIHIMSLEGTLIPLSAYLFAMSRALEDINSLSGYANVTISTPNILFGKGVRDERGGGARFYADNWDKQQEDSLNKSKIQVTFLKNMSSFVRSYLT